MSLDKMILIRGKVSGKPFEETGNRGLAEWKNRFRNINMPPEFIKKTAAGFKGSRRKSYFDPVKGPEKLIRIPGISFGDTKNSLSSNKNKLGLSDFYSVNGKLLLGCTGDLQKIKKTSTLRSVKTSLKAFKSSQEIRKREIKIPKFIFEIKKLAGQVRSSKKA